MTEQEYKTNALGHKVPVNLIKPIDLLRDELVTEIVTKAKSLQSEMAEEKAKMMKQVSDFIDLSASEHGVEYGGAKGNVTLSSFDGKYRVIKSISEHKHFDEKIQAAKKLLDDCIVSWSNNASDNLKALVEHAFRVNKQGRIDVNQVLSLRQLNIDDQKWRDAMDAIADALQIAGSSTYIRIYERTENGSYQQVSLDFAKL